MKKGTAVQFIEDKLDSLLEFYASEFETVRDVLKQAKAMEREQIIDAFSAGRSEGIHPFILSNNATHYYNETYTNTQTP